MLHSKNISKMFCLLFLLVVSSGFATSEYSKSAHISPQKKMVKKYISSDSILFNEGQMLITDANSVLHVKTIHQDSKGIFILIAVSVTVQMDITDRMGDVMDINASIIKSIAHKNKPAHHCFALKTI